MRDRILGWLANRILQFASEDYLVKSNEVTARGMAEFRKARGEKVEALYWDRKGFNLVEERDKS